MKNLLTVILFAMAINASSIVIHNDMNFKYTPFIQFACTQLEITDVTIHIVHTNLPVPALVRVTGFGGFAICINPAKCENYKRVIAHELVHIKQHLDGRWDINNGTTIVTKYGNKYVSKEAKEIEVEAMTKEHTLVKQYKVHLRSLK